MSIKETFAELEARNKRVSDEETAQRVSDAKEAEAQRGYRILKAQEIEAHLKTVVRPVLERGSKEINDYGKGYMGAVQSVQICDPIFQDFSPCFALRLLLRVRDGNTSKTAVLEYKGQFSSVTLCKMQYDTTDTAVDVVDIGDPEPSEDYRPLSQFSPSVIESDVEAFVKAAVLGKA